MGRNGKFAALQTVFFPILKGIFPSAGPLRHFAVEENRSSHGTSPLRPIPWTIVAGIQPVESRNPLFCRVGSPFSMKLPVWREVLGPTLLLGGLWLAVSTSTTIFMAWQDNAYQDLLTRNVAAVDAANDMQQAVWKVYQSKLGLIDPIELDSEPIANIDFANAVSRMRALGAPQDKGLLSQVESNFQEFQGVVGEFDRTSEGQARSRRLARLASAMSTDCHTFIESNDQVIQQRQAEFRHYIQLVLTIRQVLNIAGPMLGVWLGYRAASRLRKQISRITVRLEGFDADMGRLEVSSADPADLESLDQQVARVQERLQTTVTELNSARREVLRNERLAAVGQLAAGVAHELRNPLTSVKLLVQTGFPQAGRPTKSSAPADHNTEDKGRQFQVILDEIERMERTIQSLLDFARPPRQRRARHDLRDTVRRVGNLVHARAAQQNVTIGYAAAQQPILIDGDPSQLQQVLVNLLLNGIEAMPGGGTLSVALHPPDRESQAEDEAPFCQVEVLDNGEGIPNEVLDHLFEPFVTTKERGTGLGLAVSRRIVEEHGGELRATNRVERGACFIMRLPCVIETFTSDSTQKRLNPQETSNV